MFYTTYFDLKNVKITPGAKELFRNENITTSNFLLLLERHKFNDDDNPSKEDLIENLNAIKNGGMFLSVYKIGNEKVYIISYIDQTKLIAEETTVLLAQEY